MDDRIAQMERKQEWKLCWFLVKNRLIAQLGINTFRYEKDKRKRNNKIVTAVAILVCLFMVAGYCSALAYGYAYVGLWALIPGIAVVASSLLTLLFTMFKTNGELFGFSDYDLVMSLPIPIRTIINSRLLNMYLWNTFFTLLVMVPMGIVYALFAKPPVAFYLLWFSGLFLVCLIPTILAAIIGAGITAISSKLRHTSAIATILMIVTVVVIVVLPLTFTQGNMGPGQLFDSETGNLNEEVFSALAPQISDVIYRLYPPARLFSEAVTGGKWLSFLLFAGASIVLYGSFAALLSVKYRQMNTALTSRRSRADYRLDTLQQGSMRVALYKKTILRILKSSITATNLLVGCVMAVLLSIALLVVGPEKLAEGIQIPNAIFYFKNAAGYVIAAMVVMTNTAAVSLALEGKNIWLIKSLPIPPKTLYDGYLMTNLTFTIPTSLICSALFSISLKAGVVGTVITILTPLTFSLFTAVIGIFIGNRMAYYDWQDETQVVKQSFMSMLGMLGGMFFVAICGFIALSGIFPVSANLITFIINILLLVFAAALYVHESSRPIR